ncbi:MAG: hypothetical protein AAF467_23905 [Actinomycetota bacterium]
MSALNRFTPIAGRDAAPGNPEVDAIVASAAVAGIVVAVTEDERGQRANLDNLTPLEVDVIYDGIKANLDALITEILEPSAPVAIRRSA